MQVQDVEIRKYYRNGRQIGGGGLGRVYLVTRLADNQTLVAKEITYTNLGESALDNLFKALQEAASFEHPNIVRIHAILRDRKRQMISVIQDYVPGCSLSDLGKKYHLIKKPCPEKLVWSIFRQIAEALNYIHNHHYDFNRIYHRNLKSSNVILTTGGRVVLTDCCLVGYNLEGIYDPYRVVSDAGYIAPEIAEFSPYKPSADVWSIGVCLYELCQARRLFHRHTEATLLTEQKNLKRPIPITCSEELARFINRTLEPSPGDRPTISSILSNLRIEEAYSLAESDLERLKAGESVYRTSSSDDPVQFYPVPTEVLLDWNSSAPAPFHAVTQDSAQASPPVPVREKSAPGSANVSFTRAAHAEPTTPPQSAATPATPPVSEATSGDVPAPVAKTSVVPTLNCQVLPTARDPASTNQHLGSLSARAEVPLQRKLPMESIPPKSHSMMLSPVALQKGLVAIDQPIMPANAAGARQVTVADEKADMDTDLAVPMMNELASVAREVM